jgi:uncharacterized protein
MIPVQTKTQVVTLLQEYQQELHRFGVSRCGIFGSFVRDQNIHDRSDVDILVTFEPEQKTIEFSKRRIRRDRSRARNYNQL